MKKLFTLFASLILLIQFSFADTPMATGYAGGDGTMYNPYQIATLAQLRRCSQVTSDWDKFFILTADIDAYDTRTWNYGTGFQPIGGNNTSLNFIGGFNGNGHTISNLYIDRGTTTVVGMFGTVIPKYNNNRITIENLQLVDIDITGNLEVGGLVGLGGELDIVNCSITGTVTGTSTSADYSNTGGFVGRLIDSDIRECYADVTVTGHNRVGGIAGDVSSALYNCNIYACRAYGAVNGNSIVGGIVGIIWDGNMGENYADVQVTANINAGGLAGVARDSRISNCFAVGDVTATDVSGGLIGANGDTPIWNCYATGVNTTYTTAAHGRLIGSDGSYSSITNCAYLKISPYDDGIGQPYDAPAITELIEADFSDMSNFEAWNFNDIWFMTIVDEISPNVRPYLRRYLTLYSVDFIASGHGSLLGEAIQTIDNGFDAIPVTAIPDENYHFVEWLDESENTFSTDPTISITNVTSDLLYTAVFVPDTFQVNFSAAENGEVTGELIQNVAFNNLTTSVEAIAIESHDFSGWQDENGNTVSTSNPLAVQVKQDTLLTAHFDIKQYTLNFSADSTKGVISGDTSQIVDYGSDAGTVTAVPLEGYHFIKWLDKNEQFFSKDSTLAITNVTSDLQYTAVFMHDTLFDSSGILTIKFENVTDYNGQGNGVLLTVSGSISETTWGNGSASNYGFTASSPIGGLWGEDTRAGWGSSAGYTYKTFYHTTNYNSKIPWSNTNSQKSGGQIQEGSMSMFFFELTRSSVDIKIPMGETQPRGKIFWPGQTLNSMGLIHYVNTHQVKDGENLVRLIVLNAPLRPGYRDPNNITSSSFQAIWSNSSGANGFYLDVATDESFTNILPEYNNLDVGNVTSYEVTGLDLQTTYYYRVRAYNAYGTSSNSGVKSATTTKLSQTITFDPMDSKTYGDLPFSLSASSSSGLTVAYSSSDPGVAIVSGNEVSITGAGSCVITASQAGDDDYKAATSVEQTLEVLKKDITVNGVVATDKVYDGTVNATVTVDNLSGIINSDDVSVLSVEASFADKNVDTDKEINVNIILDGADTNNYALSQPTGLTADITKAELTVSAQDASINAGDELPVIDLNYSGFVTGEDESVLDTEPITVCSGDLSVAGDYEIIVSGGEDNNYLFVYENSTLTVTPTTGISERKVTEFIAYPNPARNTLYISTESSEIIRILDANGVLLIEKKGNTTQQIDISRLNCGMYFIQVTLDQDIITQSFIKQ